MVMWLIREICPAMATFRYSLTTSPNQLNPAWQVTQRIRNVCSELQQQINLDPLGVYKSGITHYAAHTALRTTPPMYYGTSSEGRMA